MFKFIGSIVAEMRLVTWPTKREARRDFALVVQYSVFYAVVVMIFDWLINNGIQQAVLILSPFVK
ncbi:preprotein translocase subunit SecE [Lactococcus hodotermopsidis]|uniref:Preprotein translocase subunit SecE n=1 Tax=Pseudolactococcus hodotermopsidis TaxID=2709157 RepID=A0A6A0BDN5_9LACT|nr:preprotein translocase subunit SecE [Lactococcus hodotermopsidis]GFH43522.1 preprotein translocase subunit SecE [Lactococcus hodotermopsidis]